MFKQLLTKRLFRNQIYYYFIFYSLHVAVFAFIFFFNALSTECMCMGTPELVGEFITKINFFNNNSIIITKFFTSMPNKILVYNLSPDNLNFKFFIPNNDNSYEFYKIIFANFPSKAKWYFYHGNEFLSCKYIVPGLNVIEKVPLTDFSLLHNFHIKVCFVEESVFQWITKTDLRNAELARIPVYTVKHLQVSLESLPVVKNQWYMLEVDKNHFYLNN